MTDAQWRRLAEIVPEALARPTDERAAFLDAACTSSTGAPDGALRAEAEALVAAAEAADASGALASPVVAARAPAPERVGPWRVTGVLGEGGMGVVYAAERADGAYERAVALKRLHPSVGADLGARLAAERHALARLEHPGIARLYDAGVDDAGAPYLVMERVDGQPLTAYADAAGLDARARVALFADVCDAVAYAHTRLVVHRDLKPSNVFVAPDGPDGRPSVRLLDFGIAKLLGTDVPDSLAATLTRTQAAMTPSYAAPEQITHGEVTTATDVYALGVMLYELLAGQRPYSLAGTSAAEAERIVCEADPPSPSAVAPPERARALRGDLDTIVAKALAKEPSRRYASAEALAADLRRHLDGLPVEARPATAGYRARRFVRRHRLAVAAAAAVVVALVAGAGVALWQAREARAEAAKADAVNEFLVGLLGAADPTEEGRDVRVASLLDQAAATLDSTFGGQPDVAATMHRTLGTTYLGLGLYNEAERHFRQALDVRTRLFGPLHRDAIESQSDLGTVWLDQDRLADADSLLSVALAAARRALPPRDPLTGTVLSNLGYVRFVQSDYEASLAMHRESVAIEEAKPSPDPVELAAGLGNVAVVLENLGRAAEAAPIQERQLAIYREMLGPDNSRVARALDNLGVTYHSAGRLDDALDAARDAVATFRRTVPPDSPELAGALRNLGPVLVAAGQPAEAERVLREAVAVFEQAVGAEHRRTASARTELGRALHALGRSAEAEALIRDALATTDRVTADGHPARAHGRIALGTLLVDTGRAPDAVPLLREAVAVRAAALPAGHPERAVATSLLGDALARAGQAAEGGRLLRSAHEALARAATRDTALARLRDEAAARLAAVRR